MMPNELTEQLRSEIKNLKGAQEAFLKTVEALCKYHGGPNGLRKKSEMVFHRVRSDIIPMMEQAGMDQWSAQALCSWAEQMVGKR